MMFRMMGCIALGLAISACSNTSTEQPAKLDDAAGIRAGKGWRVVGKTFGELEDSARWNEPRAIRKATPESEELLLTSRTGTEAAWVNLQTGERDEFHLEGLDSPTCDREAFHCADPVIEFRVVDSHVYGIRTHRPWREDPDRPWLNAGDFDDVEVLFASAAPDAVSQPYPDRRFSITGYDPRCWMMGRYAACITGPEGSSGPFPKTHWSFDLAEVSVRSVELPFRPVIDRVPAPSDGEQEGFQCPLVIGDRVEGRPAAWEVCYEQRRRRVRLFLYRDAEQSVSAGWELRDEVEVEGHGCGNDLNSSHVDLDLFVDGERRVIVAGPPTSPYCPLVVFWSGDAFAAAREPELRVGTPEPDALIEPSAIFGGGDVYLSTHDPALDGRATVYRVPADGEVAPVGGRGMSDQPDRPDLFWAGRLYAVFRTSVPDVEGVRQVFVVATPEEGGGE